MGYSIRRRQLVNFRDGSRHFCRSFPAFGSSLFYTGAAVKTFNFELLGIDKEEKAFCAKFALIEGDSRSFYFVKYSTKKDKMYFYLALNKALLGVCSRAELLFALAGISKSPCSAFVASLAESVRFKGDDRLLVLITEAFKAFNLPMWSGEMVR